MKFVARARRRVKFSHNERMRRLRLGDLRKLFADRCRGPILPDDDAGRDYLRELLLPISLGPNEAVKGSGAIAIWGPTDRMLREIELRAPWMSDDWRCYGSKRSGNARGCGGNDGADNRGPFISAAGGHRRTSLGWRSVSAAALITTG